MPPRKHDWAAIREAFIRAPEPMIQTEFAKAQGLRLDAMNKRVQSEGWLDERSKYWRMVNERLREKTADAEAELRARQVTLARQMQDIGRGGMAQHLIGRDDTGRVVVRVTDPDSLRRLAIDGAKMERDAFGIEQEVRVRVDKATEAALDRLQRRLPADVYVKVLEALTEGSDGEDA